jgi:tetratricopeptide (TPR) repeat protein
MHAAIGMADYKLKNCREAIPVLKKSLPFESSRDAAIDMLADCYKQLQMPDGALALFRELDEQGIEYPIGWFELGNDAAARGDDEASVRYFSRFLAKRPDNVAAQFNMASALHRKGLFAESLAAADRCASLNALPEVVARCLILGADNLMRLGRQPEAYQHFERAKTLDPKNPWIRK